MQNEEGFQLVIQQSLLDQTGGLTVDFLTGPVRKGFQIQAVSLGGGGCDSGTCAC